MSVFILACLFSLSNFPIVTVGVRNVGSISSKRKSIGITKTRSIQTTLGIRSQISTAAAYAVRVQVMQKI